MHKRLIIWDYPRSEHVKFWVTMAVALLIGLLMPGCAALQERPATVAFLAEYATSKTIYESSDPEARAAGIAEAANDVLEIIDSGEAVEIAALRVVVQRYIDRRDLTPPDRIALSRLVDILGEELQIRFGTGVLDPTDVVSVRRVVELVRDTATNFEPE